MQKVIEAVHITKIYGKHITMKSNSNAVGSRNAQYTASMQEKVKAMVNTSVETVALNDVSLDVEEGDFVCIMGPSGSGKTTLLNAISTIDPPTKGKVFVQGENIRAMGDNQIGRFRYQYLGFIFQKFNLLENMTIFENIAIPLTLVKTSDEEIRRRVVELAEKIRIEDILDKFPSQCSGGQCQRCAIARALIKNPKLIVADEPTGNLDSKNSHEILQLLQELNRKEGVTIMMVTHDAMIASYAKRLLFLMDGRIETVLEKKETPQKDFYYQIMDVTSHEAMQFLEEKA